MTIQLPTEPDVAPADDEPDPATSWPAWATFLIVSIVLAMAVGFLIWAGTASSSAPGGCGGG